MENAALTQLITPRVHLNGTSKEDLLEALSTASDAIHSAIDAVAATVPNGRDHYNHPVRHALTKALSQHDSRIERLASVRDEIHTLMEAICDHA